MTDPICIQCGEKNTTAINCDDFDTITCSNCDNEYTVADVEKAIGALSRLVRRCRAARAVIDAEETV